MSDQRRDIEAVSPEDDSSESEGEEAVLGGPELGLAGSSSNQPADS